MLEPKQTGASATSQEPNLTSGILEGLNITTGESESQFVDILKSAINNSASIPKLNNAITNLAASISGKNISNNLRQAISGMLLIAHQVKALNYSATDVTDGTARNMEELYLQMTDQKTGGYIDINVNSEIKRSFLSGKKDEYGFFAKLKELVKAKYIQELQSLGGVLALDNPSPNRVDIDLNEPLNP